jgi:hypothetical protein
MVCPVFHVAARNANDRFHFVSAIFIIGVLIIVRCVEINSSVVNKGARICQMTVADYNIIGGADLGGCKKKQKSAEG